MPRFRRWTILLCGAFCVAGVRAQDQRGVQTCDVSFFNATTLEKSVFLDWSGRDAFPDGLAAGRSMGPLMVPAAEGATIEAKAEGCLPAKGDVKLGAGQKTSLIFYLGPPEKDPEGGSPKPRIRVFQTQLKPSGVPSKEYQWPVLYLGEDPSVQIQFNGQPAVLNRGKTTVLGAGQKIIEIKQADKQIAAVSVEEPVDYLIVIYGDDQNLRGGVVYR